MEASARAVVEQSWEVSQRDLRVSAMEQKETAARSEISNVEAILREEVTENFARRRAVIAVGDALRKWIDQVGIECIAGMQETEATQRDLKKQLLTVILHNTEVSY